MLDVSRLAEPLTLHRKKSASAPKDELDEVAEAINGMSENLRDSYARLSNELERRKITEARLKAAYDEMEAKVRERTDELSRAMKHAESASNAKSQFLADMSHEVRTPLNGVLGMLHVLRESPLGPHQKKHVDMALSAGNSLLAVINDILDFSKIEAGMIEMENSVFSLRDVLEQVNAVFEHEAKPKGLHVTWRLDGRIPELVAGDQARLRQILFNIIGNAVKFTPNGEVLTEVYPLQDSKSDGPLRLLFAVSDTGIGIPEDNLPHIFDKFTQFEGDSAIKLKGTGLGLGIVKRLVKLMNGDVDVDSKEGSGTTVYFCLELGRHSMSESEGSKACAPAAQNGETTPSPAKLRILLAEDNLINRIAAQTLLERMGHKVKSAEDGNQALQMLAVGDFDLVLMDIQMPVMDGLEATRIIRGSRPADGIDPKIPIIAMTAHTMKGDRESFLAEGMDDYIPKPFSPDVVAGVLARYAPDCRS
jgi:signal transduction histidine kinase/CheY-like chemotaxis protein